MCSPVQVLDGDQPRVSSTSLCAKRVGGYAWILHFTCHARCESCGSAAANSQESSCRQQRSGNCAGRRRISVSDRDPGAVHHPRPFHGVGGAGGWLDRQERPTTPDHMRAFPDLWRRARTAANLLTWGVSSEGIRDDDHRRRDDRTVGLTRAAGTAESGDHGGSGSRPYRAGRLRPASHGRTPGDRRAQTARPHTATSTTSPSADSPPRSPRPVRTPSRRPWHRWPRCSPTPAAWPS